VYFFVAKRRYQPKPERPLDTYYYKVFGELSVPFKMEHYMDIRDKKTHPLK
jgi:hypothetical protein